jgi:hypothetical protein
MTSKWLVCLLFVTSQAMAAAAVVTSHVDPGGDDNGAGNLLYPMNRDYQEGDLDLRKVTLSRDSDGFWFEVGFANPIRDPAAALMGPAADSVADYVRKGFYNFNVDVYIDTDRRRGSGNSFTLPGRHLRIDPGYAWERAVILTPRPELVRTELMEALLLQYPEHSGADLEASIDQAIYFPTRTKVRGKTVAFFVPLEFLGDGDGSDWAMTVLVTGAKPYISVGSMMSSNKTPLEDLDLGVLQSTPARSPTLFGYTGRVQAPPVVDVLLPTVQQQAALLANQAPLTGVSWGKHAADDSVLAVRGTAASRQAGNAEPDAVTARPGGFLKGMTGDPVPRSRALSKGVRTVGALLDPPPARSTSTDSANRPQPSVATRLQTLKKLLDDGLITEAEFNQHKARILGDL